MTTRIRLATESDAEQILAIYAPFVRDTAVTFEITIPTVEEFAERVSTVLQRAPWLVCEDTGHVLGYAYATHHREREAYRWCVESSVYIHAKHRRNGVGRALYNALFDCLRLQGYYTIYAGIALPNPASISLHEGMGFEPVGVYRASGYKLGRWHDAGWWQLALRAYDAPPSPPLLLGEVVDTEGGREALKRASNLLTSSPKNAAPH